MEYRLLELFEVKSLVRRGWIPQHYLPRLDELYVFGGVDDNGSILSAAVFVDCTTKKFAVALKQLFVRPELRGDGIARETYAFAEKSFTDIGIREIECECVVVPELAESRVSLMTALKFSPMYISKSARCFMKGHFRGENMDRLYQYIGKSGVELVTIENYGDRRLLPFWEDKEKTGIFIPRDEYNPDLWVFGLIGGKVESALGFRRYEGRSLMTEGYYASDRVKNKDALLPFMMSYMVKRGEETDFDFDRVYAVFDKSYRGDAAEQTFGKAMEEYYLQKYVKVIQ